MSKILSKLKNKHFLALAGNMVIALFGFVTTGILYRILSKPDAGKWVLFITVLSICDGFRNGFLGTATVKFYAGTTYQKGTRVLGSVWFLAIMLTLIVLTINAASLFALPHLHGDEGILIIKWAGLTFLSSLPFSVIYWKLQADEDYIQMLWLKMVNSISTPLSFVLLYFFGKITLENIVIWNLLTNCLTSAVGLIFGLGRMKAIFRSSREHIMELVHFGKHSMGASLSATLLSSADTFIIRAVLGPAALAIYNVPRNLMQFVEMILRTFVGTGMSGMAIAFNQKNMHQVTYILKKYAGMLTFALMPLTLGAILFADVAIRAMSGGKYVGTEAANIFRLFMIFCLVFPIDRFNGVTLDIIHKPKINFYKVILMLVLTVVTDFAALSIYKDLYSVAIAGFITTLGAITFGYYHLRKYISYTIPEILSTGLSEIGIYTRKYTGMLSGKKGPTNS